MSRFDSVELIKELSLAFGPSGCEDSVRELIKKYAEPLAQKTVTDRMGNLICRMSFGDLSAENRKRLMISAHMDEVGFMIAEIRDDGMLTFGCVGGMDPSVIAGRKLTVGNERGQISGLTCSKAIHHKKPDEREKALTYDKLYIDIGYDSREEAEAVVSVGDFATFDSEFYLFGKNDRTVKSKALDDRMGCAAMLEIMDSLASAPAENDIDVFFCFTVREEIGFSGAVCAAELIRPQYAIVLETTAIGDIPTAEPRRRVADVGEGGVLSVMDRATIYDKDFIAFALDTGKKNGIKAQLKRYVAGGNDAGKIHKSAEGVRPLALSVPTRYLHSAACVASLDDYEAVRDLTEAMVRGFDI